MFLHLTIILVLLFFRHLLLVPYLHPAYHLHPPSLLPQLLPLNLPRYLLLLLLPPGRKSKNLIFFILTFYSQPCTWIAVLLVLVRLILLPLFLFSNYLPDTRVVVVLVQWDWTFALLVTIFAFLEGFVLQLLVVSILRYSTPTLVLVKL